MLLLVFELAAFIIGLLFGSFLNVCISRFPDHLSIVKPRSHCTHCGHTIRWHDNVPVLSWLVLRAKCRDCKVRISWRYPLVEISMGIWSLMCLNHYFMFEFNKFYKFYFPKQTLGSTTNELLTDIAFAILGFLLIGLLVMDWQTHILPDSFTLTGTAIGLFLVCVQAIFLPMGAEDIHLTQRSNLRMSSPGSFAAKGNVFLTGPEHLIFGRLAAIIGAALILILIRVLYKALRKREGLGLGDVKLLAMIAAFLGFWPAVLALLIGVITSAVFAIFLLARRRADMATQLPFGTFLCIGGLAAALIGEPVIAWYRSLL